MRYIKILNGQNILTLGDEIKFSLKALEYKRLDYFIFKLIKNSANLMHSKQTQKARSYFHVLSFLKRNSNRNLFFLSINLGEIRIDIHKR